LAQVSAAAGPRTRVVVVLVAGGPVDITTARDDPKVGARSHCRFAPNRSSSLRQIL
jgi:hypothetical protein